jgi:hypothetical protein
MSAKSDLRNLENWSVGRLRRWKGNIKIIVINISFEDRRWMELALVLSVPEPLDFFY